VYVYLRGCTFITRLKQSLKTEPLKQSLKTGP
jgi:hypothetical protein